MFRPLIFASILLVAGLDKPAAAQNGPADGLPPRPAPFQFVNDQARLLAPADAKKLEGGLRRYANNTGTQVVVVTVPSLGGREVADYGRALGTAWGVGQRGKNNGVVVLLSGQERKVTIQPGSGLKSVITPAVTSRIIGEMTPSFKAGNYFAGLRTGLNTLMLTANPSSNPQKNQVAAANSADAASGMAAPSAEAARSPQANLTDETPAPAATTTTNDPIMARPAPEPASSGIGMGTLLLGALLVGGVLWFLVRMFRNRNTAAAPSAAPASATPNFLPNRPNGPASGPGQAPGNYGTPNQGGGMMGGMGGGMGMGGILATGAAAAAGAYLGNRMASGSDTSGNSGNGLMGGGNERPADTGAAAGAGAVGAGAAGAAGTDAASDFFSSRDGAAATPAPDYFADDASAADNSSSDYFSSDDNASSYDDTSSNDTGGGGFDGDSSSSDDDSGSW